MSQQLVKKGANGRMVNVNPKSWIEAIKDKNTGQTLVEILQGFNMYFLPYNGNTSSTRCLVPTMLRKKGLWITYVKYDGNVYTEWYAADELDDKSWGDSSNWRIGNNTLVGDITISANGNWVINGTETEFKAVGEKGNTPLIRVANNRLQVSYDLGDTYIDVTNNPVYTKFRWLATTGDTQANNVGRIQASTDEGKTWTNMSNDFTNNLHIKKYIGVNESLPTSGIAEGTIYAKGPYYAEDDTLNDNPIYRLWVYAWKGNTLAWQDNGEFQSIAAGVVQETGDSETEVMSQKAVTDKLSELGSKVGKNYILELDGSEWLLDGFLNGISGSIYVKRIVSSGGDVSTVIYEGDDGIGSIFDYWSKIDIASELSNSKLYTSASKPCSVKIQIVAESTLMEYINDNYATKDDVSLISESVKENEDNITDLNSEINYINDELEGNPIIKEKREFNAQDTVIYEFDKTDKITISVSPSIDVYMTYGAWNSVGTQIWGDTKLIHANAYNDLDVEADDVCKVSLKFTSKIKASVVIKPKEPTNGVKGEIIRLSNSLDEVKNKTLSLSKDVDFLNNEIEGSAAVREHKEFKNGEWVIYNIPSTNKVLLSVSPSIAVYMSLGANNSSSTQIWGATHLLEANKANTFEITANDIVEVKLRFTSNISASVEIKTEEDTNGIKGELKRLGELLVNVNEIHVKKDGSGDFTTIQTAINSITDNSENNQYIVYVHDDWFVDDMTELVLQNNPLQYSGATPTQGCALIVTKDYVTVKGYGRQVKVVVAPSDKNLPESAFSYIHTAFMWGNSTIENMCLELAGGRYTVHQDIGSGGDNRFKTLSILNCVVTHKGNDEYPNSAWTAQAAFGIGTSDGETIRIENSKFISPYFSPILSHSNNSFTKGNVWIFDKVEIACTKSTELRRLLTYMNDYGSGQKSYVYITGCNFPVVPFGNSAIQSTSDFAHCNLHDNGGFKINGYGNVKSTARIEAYSGLIVCSKNKGENVDVVGGTAYNDVWVSTFKSYKSDANSYGVAIGSARIAGGNFLLGKRLGDCSVTNKTLIVRIGSNNYTLTLTDNYSDMSENDVLAKLNALNSNIVFNSGGNAVYAAYNSFMGTMAKLDVYNDCKETGVNVGSSALYPMQLVVRDRTKGYNAWRIASVDENPEGVVGERIDVGSNGDILLIDKSYFGGRCPNQSQTQSYFAQFTAGRSYGVGADGYPTLKDNGALIAIDSNFLSLSAK